MLHTVLIAILSCMWLFMASPVPSLAQPPPVLDTSKRPLTSGVNYYIKPAIGSRLTLVPRNGTNCPLFVGQNDVAGSKGLPVTFSPFFKRETIIRENRDVQIVFQALKNVCQQSTQWVLGETAANRRLIAAGKNGEAGGFFRIEQENGNYNIAWCPTDVCPFCRFRCGRGGVLVEKGVKLLALDGAVLPVVFERA